MGASISVVVPVYNEEGNVAELHKEIKAVCERERLDYEIIFIDDGSTDRTREIMKGLYPLKAIYMRKNFGQTAAMDAGIKAASRDYIVTMDGDRQNDPEDIPRLIAYLEENHLDVVSGWRKNRKDTKSKKFTSRGANLLRKIIIQDKIHDSGCSLKIYKRECFQDVNLYGEMHRFIPALLENKGYKVGEIVVNHRERTAGTTKYNWKRIVKGFEDMLDVRFWHYYAVRPLHLLGTGGIVMLLFGILSALGTLWLFFTGSDLSNTFQPVITICFLMAGMFLFVCGLMCDILVKIYFGAQIDKPYSIEKIEENHVEETA